MIPEEHARAGIEGVEVITERELAASRIEQAADDVVLHVVEADGLRISAQSVDGLERRYHLAFTEQNLPRSLYSSTLFLSDAQARSLLRVLSQAMTNPQESA